jgi:hypothetical protein
LLGLDEKICFVILTPTFMAACFLFFAFGLAMMFGIEAP